MFKHLNAHDFKLKPFGIGSNSSGMLPPLFLKYDENFKLNNASLYQIKEYDQREGVQRDY